MTTIPLPPAGWIDSLPGPVLVTGAKGMLGWEWMRALDRLGGGDKVLGLGRAEMDVTREDSVRAAIERHRPSLVIHCAAYTNVDRAETEREAAHLANAVAPGYVARACRDVGARLIHYSTDQVFDGEGHRPRVETDTPRPLNQYGATKLAGEAAALEAPGSLVLRVQWLYGERKDRFTILKDKTLFTPFADQIGAPTWTRDIVEVSLALAFRRAEGLFHLSYDNHASWATVFERVKDKLKLNVKLEPKKTAEFSLPAARPLFSVLSNRKLCGALGVPGLGRWEEALDEFLLPAVIARSHPPS
jgi:dTDP-4-dehydrorhamnose reductase